MMLKVQPKKEIVPKPNPNPISKEKRAEIEARLLKAIPDDIPSVRTGPRGCLMLTEEHISIVEVAISKGFPYAMAADLLGVAKSSLSEYLSRRPRIAERLKKAEALHITKHLELIDQASVKNWQASAWKLERRHREHFGQQQQVNVAGAVANVHFTAADAAVLVAATKAKFAGSSDTDRTTIDVTPEKSGKPIVAAERHLKDKPAG